MERWKEEWKRHVNIIFIGILTYANDEKYDGHWNDDHKNGRGNFFNLIGIQYYDDDSKYDGEWKMM